MSPLTLMTFNSLYRSIIITGCLNYDSCLSGQVAILMLALNFSYVIIKGPVWMTGQFFF